MSQASCIRRDPVELLLKGILRSTLLYACAWSFTDCADPETRRGEPETSDSGSAGDDPDSGSADADGEAPGDSAIEPLPTACVERTTVEASALAPAEAYDYLAVRRRSNQQRFDFPGASTEWMVVLSEVGEPCAKASDKAACTTALKAEPSDISEISALTTRGDEVKNWPDFQGIRALLGEINTPAEAELLAIVAGYAVCGNQPTRATADGYAVNASRAIGCAPVRTQATYSLSVDRMGFFGVLSSTEPKNGPGCVGRMPAGLCSEAADRGQDALGDMLARAAHLEAASVFAFERLARELFAHGAPAHLIQAALAAREDEITHARSVAALARAHGGEPVEAAVLPFAVRTLEEVACENAVEGCVRETYGALVGAHQALCAEDPELREAMQKIGDDEARHAALSHRVDAWIMERLDASARERVRAAKRVAVRELCAASLEAEVSELEQRAGFPPPQVARNMVTKLARTLWADALTAT